ncbi:MAG TPA: hypothetical protein VML54_04810, partial [Candidatus Limnocylindrales bacterium]|nr:hypothetical protein [Candidatus Limnocylindrales bacterium]
SVTPEPGVTRVNVLFSVVPAGSGRAPAPEDLFLLWPGEVKGDPRLSQRDPALARYVEERGFDVVGEGRVVLSAQRQSAAGSEPALVSMAGGAPYVTFVQSGGPLGLSPPATWIRIPATPKLTDSGWLMDLEIPSASMVKPKQATWLEDVFLGPRFLVSMSFNEVRDRPLFPMYFTHRSRIVRLADAPAELVANFSDAARLKIDQVYPLNTIRRLSETLESTEVVSLFLDASEGLSPQQLTVQFGYFSRAQAVGVVLVPMLILVLGYAVGPLVGRVAVHVLQVAMTYVRIGGWNAAPRERRTGVIIAPEVLAKIGPGQTTFDQVLELCGAGGEISERYLSGERRRTLIYRGRLVRPRAQRLLGWLYAVRESEVEHHEVRIDLEGDVVRDVQADIRRSRVPAGEIP